MQKNSKSIQPLFDAIVIGAGATGCNTAWHLSQRGLKVLVVEASSGAATQASGAAGGFIASWSSVHNPIWGKNEWEMQRYGIEFYKKFAANCQKDIGFHSCGIAYIYRDSQAWKEAQPRLDLARQFGTQLEILNEKRATEIVPIINFSKVAGIVFDPDAIRMRAGEAFPALAESLQKSGVQFRFNTCVTGFIRDKDKILGIHTHQGDIASRFVVIAAGAWSRPLLENEGVPCPVIPHVETRYTTRPLPGIPPKLPLLIFSDIRSFYIREEKGGLLIGGSDHLPLPKDRWVDVHHPPFSQQIVPDQAYRIREYIREIETVMPVLKNAEIEKISSGLPTFTADVHFVADKVPEREGLFAINACQEGGVTHGPGLARIVTELMLDGTTKWDCSLFRLDRFQSLNSPKTISKTKKKMIEKKFT